MFCYLCANCGSLEMLHFKEMLHTAEELRSNPGTYPEILERELKESVQTGLWIDEEYQDRIEYMRERMYDYAGGDQSPEVVARRLMKRRAGYKYSLVECPGFSYREKDYREAAEAFFRSNYLEYLPEQLQEEVEKCRLKITEEE